MASIPIIVECTSDSYSSYLYLVFELGICSLSLPLWGMRKAGDKNIFILVSRCITVWHLPGTSLAVLGSNWSFPYFSVHAGQMTR